MDFISFKSVCIIGLFSLIIHFVFRIFVPKINNRSLPVGRTSIVVMNIENRKIRIRDPVKKSPKNDKIK